MVVPPLAVIRPPQLAVVALTSVTSVVAIVASSPLSFLQPKTVNSSASVTPVSQILEELKVLWFMGSMGYQLSVIGCRLSVVGYRLSVIGYRLSVIGYRLSVVGCRLSVIGYRLSVVGFLFSVVSSLLFICSLLPHDATEPFFGEHGAANHAVAVV
jgi:hypothetical protein